MYMRLTYTFGGNQPFGSSSLEEELSPETFSVGPGLWPNVLFTNIRAAPEVLTLDSVCPDHL